MTSNVTVACRGACTQMFFPPCLLCIALKRRFRAWQWLLSTVLRVLGCLNPLSFLRMLLQLPVLIHVYTLHVMFVGGLGNDVVLPPRR